MASKRRRHRPTSEELDDRVSVPLDSDEFVEGILQAGPHPEDRQGTRRGRDNRRDRPGVILVPCPEGAVGLIELGPNEVSDLSPLRCTLPGEPWTEEAEGIARDMIRGARYDRRIRVLAHVEGSQVTSLVAWRPLGDLPTWEVLVLAVDHSAQRQGLASQLIEEVAARAETSGNVSGLYMLVRPGNLPMRQFVSTYRGKEAEAEESDTHLVCAIPLPLERLDPFFLDLDEESL